MRSVLQVNQITCLFLFLFQDYGIQPHDKGRATDSAGLV